MTLPASSRQAAHTLLDTIGAFRAAPQARDPAVMLASRRMAEIGVVSASIDDETDVVTIDLSELLAGVLVSTEWLISTLAAATGVSHDDVIRRLRQFLDLDA